MDRDLGSLETDLVGAWLVTPDGVVGDEATNRIEDQTKNHLVKVAEAGGGWDWLYRDPRDGRYWELTYPQGWQHGGGPPRLTVIQPIDAAAKYDLPESD